MVNFSLKALLGLGSAPRALNRGGNFRVAPATVPHHAPSVVPRTTLEADILKIRHRDIKNAVGFIFNKILTRNEGIGVDAIEQLGLFNGMSWNDIAKSSTFRNMRKENRNAMEMLYEIFRENFRIKHPRGSSTQFDNQINLVALREIAKEHPSVNKLVKQYDAYRSQYPE